MMPTLPGPTLCPNCKILVSVRTERCPACGRMMHRVIPKEWYAQRWVFWLAPVVVLFLLWAFGSSIPEPPRLTAGSIAVVRHSGAAGAWLAVNDDAFAAMLDAQNSGSGELLGYLVEKGRVFREPNGGRVLVVRMGLGRCFVRVREGVNPDLEGWVQSELLAPAQR